MFDGTFKLGLREDAIADEVAQEEGNQYGCGNATWLRPKSSESASPRSQTLPDVGHLPDETAFTEVG